jgi:hypothetical protein
LPPPRVIAAGALRPLDRAVDVVLRHVLLAGFLNRDAEPEVRVRIGQARARRDGDLPRELGEELAALIVGDALLTLDR